MSGPDEPDLPPEACQAILAAPGFAPDFALGVACSAQAVTRIVFLPPQTRLLSPQQPVAVMAAYQLSAWLADPRYRFDLPLAPAGTAFRQRVWQAIADIPCGETRSYGALARQLDSAARAVGQACGDNPYPVVVPCHRVVAAGGRLGGFNHARRGWLLAAKEWLLAHERQPFA